MALEARKLAAEIMSEVHAANLPGGEASKAPSPSDFCDLWPKAKPILGFIAGIAALIPGLGQQAGAILNGLIKVGDQIAASVCKS